MGSEAAAGHVPTEQLSEEPVSQGRAPLSADGTCVCGLSEEPISPDCAPLVSIVIPVYDIEPYVGDAIRSVIGQTLENWELICVDDGSHDGSLPVCQRFADSDKRITVVSQEHAGLGAARNHGISHARGKYVYFLDGDDMIVPDALERCVQAAEDNDADMVLFGAQVLVQDGKRHDERFYVRSRAYPGIWDGVELYVAQRQAGDYRAQACLYLSRRDLLCGSGACPSHEGEFGQVNAGAFLSGETVYLSNAGVFPQGVIHEDECGTFRLLTRARRVVCLQDLLYFRRYRPNSIMSSRDWRASARGYFRAYAEAYADASGDDAASDALAHARRLHMDAQSAGCIGAFYRTGTSVDEFPSVVDARVEDAAALASLLERKELDPRFVPMFRAKRRVRQVLGTAKRGAGAVWRIAAPVRRGVAAACRGTVAKLRHVAGKKRKSSRVGSEGPRS